MRDSASSAIGDGFNSISPESRFQPLRMHFSIGLVGAGLRQKEIRIRRFRWLDGLLQPCGAGYPCSACVAAALSRYVAIRALYAAFGPDATFFVVA